MSKEALRDWLADRIPVIWFVVKFALLMILFYGLLAIPFFDRLLYANLEVNAWLANAILKALGEETAVVGTTISSPVFAIAVHRGCDAIEPTWLFCAAIISIHSSALRKGIGILCGAFLLHFLNLVRIVSLYWIGIHQPGIFHSAHVEIWPVLFILVEVLLFIAWIRLFPSKIKTDA